MASHVDVPYASLSPEALDALIEDYVTREGTDYGEREYSLSDKRAQVLAQLTRGEAQVVFDLESETATLVTRAQRQLG